MSATLTDIKVECAGRWSSVLTNIGIDAEYLSGKHGPCPVCGGKDRFRWSHKREMAYCSGCGHKSPLDLAIAYLGRPFKETAAEIRQILGVTTMETAAPAADDREKNEKRIRDIHKGLKVITPDSVAARYLAGRGLKVLPETGCYFHPAMPYYEDGKKIGEYPAMVSSFRTVNDELSTYHITYLSADGKKADVSAQKKILPTIRPLSGSAIRLFNPVNGVLAIAEGIETSLAVHQDQGLPVWAAGNAGNMAAMHIPDSVNEVWIYADMDANFTGQQAAYTLAKRLQNEGKQVVVVTLRAPLDFVDVVTDSGIKLDFLDALLLMQHDKSQA